MWLEAEPENPLREVWAYITPKEARELLLALQYWSEESLPQPGWHHHITDSGRELTIAVGREEAEGRFANRGPRPS